MDEIKSVKGKEAKKTVSITTRRITYIATLVAMTVLFKVLSSFLTITDSIRISFIYFGWIISAVMLGPLGGATVGCVSDILGSFIAPTGPFNPIITLGNTLFPFIIGIVYLLPFTKNKQLKVIIGTILSTIICTLGINSLALYFTFGYNISMSFFTYLILNRWIPPIVIAVNLTVVLAILPVVSKFNLSTNLTN